MFKIPQTKEENVAVEKILRRAVPDFCADRTTLWMDLLAAHNQYPLDLEALAEADPENFAHDIAGIVGHIDRRTGKLTDCFVPRYARSE